LPACLLACLLQRVACLQVMIAEREIWVLTDFVRQQQEAARLQQQKQLQQQQARRWSTGGGGGGIRGGAAAAEVPAGDAAGAVLLLPVVRWASSKLEKGPVVMRPWSYEYKASGWVVLHVLLCRGHEPACLPAGVALPGDMSQ
jgi:hypothetical protein